MKSILILTCSLVSILLCLIVGNSLGSNLPSTSKTVNTLDPGIVLARGREVLLGGFERMDSRERVLFVKYIAMLRKWEQDIVSSSEMNALLNWSERKIRCSVVVPRKTLRLGEVPRVAFLIKNLSDKPSVVFPFEKVRLTDRGHKEDGIRTDVFGFNERPSDMGYLYLIPPHDEIVVSISLGPQPAGVYRANVVVNLAKFTKAGKARGFDMSMAARETVEFKTLVVPAENSIRDKK